MITQERELRNNAAWQVAILLCHQSTQAPCIGTLQIHVCFILSRNNRGGESLYSRCFCICLNKACARNIYLNVALIREVHTSIRRRMGRGSVFVGLAEL